MKTLEVLTSAELRKKASELKIKNYASYKKEELIRLIEEIEKPKKRERKTLSSPRGSQSKEILEMIVSHKGEKSWTLYKISQLLGCTYTNVRRVYLKYVLSHDTEI